MSLDPGTEFEKGYRDGHKEERQRVLDLIDQRIEKWDDKVENTTGFDRLVLNDAKARREELKELKESIRKTGENRGNI